MSGLIGQIEAGDGVTTTFTLQNLPQYLFVDSIWNNLNIEGLEIEIDGQTVWSLKDQDPNVMEAMGQTGVPSVGVDNGTIFQISNGYLENVPCVVRVTNAAASSADLYGVSVQSVPLADFNPTEARTEIVFDSQSKQMFGESFDLICFDTTNFDKCDVVLESGYTMANIGLTELQAFLLMMGSSLPVVSSSTCVIDNSTDFFRSITFYAKNDNLSLAVKSL